MNELKNAVKDLSQKVYEDIQEYGWIHEANDEVNDASRHLIAMAHQEWGQVYLIHVNLYGADRGKREAICQQWAGELVYNFGCDAIAPTADEVLIDLIFERDRAPYEGPKKDYERVTAIHDRLKEIGGHHLFWA